MAINLAFTSDECAVAPRPTYADEYIEIHKDKIVLHTYSQQIYPF